MDGYSPYQDENYADQKMNIHTEIELAKKKNAGMESVLAEYKQVIDLEMITSPKYVIV